MTTRDKREVLTEVNTVMANWPRKERACLYYAAHAALALSKRGVRAILQAGSASWRFKAPAQDDGGVTHYSYLFDPAVPHPIECLPEMHCWVGIVNTGEIVDLTTGFVPGLMAIALPDEKWTEPVPPPYFWGGRQDIPNGWIYDATLDAVLLAYRFLAFTRTGLFLEMQMRGIAPTTEQLKIAAKSDPVKRAIFAQ